MRSSSVAAAASPSPPPPPPPEKPRVHVLETKLGKQLIVDDTFASLRRPGEVATKCVWDALAAPLLAFPKERLAAGGRDRLRVLVLGLGGGSAARILRALAPEATIVGVEYDPEVLAAARKHFDLDSLGLEVVQGDAREYLEQERGEFDMIIDDVFLGPADILRKPHWLPLPGHELAIANLLRKDGGILVSNTCRERDRVIDSMSGQFPGLVEITVEEYTNCIIMGGPAALDAQELEDAVSSCPFLGGSLGILGFWNLKCP